MNTAAFTDFPLKGVIGIIDTSVDLLEKARQSKLQCVEVRADLLMTAGLSESQVFDLVNRVKRANLSCLLTLRHKDQGGTFNGAEDERVAFCLKAFEAGADIIDLEHGTASSEAMLAAGKPVILSYHNFERMLSATELDELTQRMEAQSPAAVKIIPTGQTLDDAASMLSWLDSASACRRIGFAMGEAGAYSRVTALALGSPVTYASFGEPVAPGQVAIETLLHEFQCMDMNKQTRFIAAICDIESPIKQLHSNAELAAVLQRVRASKTQAANSTDSDCVVLPFSSDDENALESIGEVLAIDEIVKVQISSS